MGASLHEEIHPLDDWYCRGDFPGQIDSVVLLAVVDANSWADDNDTLGTYIYDGTTRLYGDTLIGVLPTSWDTT